MSVSALSRRYAKALVAIGVEQQSVDQFGDELEAVRSILTEQALFRQLLESPTLPVEKKSAMISELGQQLALSKGVASFLGLLVTKDRLRYLGTIEENYRRLADELSGILSAKITAAVELDDLQQQAIATSLEKQTGMQVAVSVTVDPELIGGVKAEIGGRLFDGSVRTQLKRIEESLKKG